MTPSGQLPDGWAQAALGDLLTAIETGKSFRCEERPPEEGEVGVLKVSAVSWGSFDDDESKTILDGSRANPTLFVAPGDFLFSRRTPSNSSAPASSRGM